MLLGLCRSDEKRAEIAQRISFTQGPPFGVASSDSAATQLRVARTVFANSRSKAGITAVSRKSFSHGSINGSVSVCGRGFTEGSLSLTACGSRTILARGVGQAHYCGAPEDESASSLPLWPRFLRHVHCLSSAVIWSHRFFCGVKKRGFAAMSSLVVIALGFEPHVELVVLSK